MKKLLTCLLLLVMSAVVFGCSSKKDTSAKQSNPEIIIVEEIKLDAKGVVTLSGAGFTPGEEVTILFTTTDGIQSDISYAFKPAPETAADGTWTTEWAYGRFVKKKLVDEGSYTLVAVDEDYNEMATATFTFVQ